MSMPLLNCLSEKDAKLRRWRPFGISSFQGERAIRRSRHNLNIFAICIHDDVQNPYEKYILFGEKSDFLSFRAYHNDSRKAIHSCDMQLFFLEGLNLRSENTAATGQNFHLKSSKLSIENQYPRILSRTMGSHGYFLTITNYRKIEIVISLNVFLFVLLKIFYDFSFRWDFFTRLRVVPNKGRWM